MDAFGVKLGGTTTVASVALLYCIVVHGIVYIWQIVGVIRACDRYYAAFGSITQAYATYLGIVISLIFTLASLFSIYQNVIVTRLFQDDEQVRLPQYALSVSSDGRAIYLSGEFELGITDALRRHLQQNEAIGAIVLSSHGGNIYAGRGVASLIQTRGLDSYVYETCYSTCTTAFIAGKVRTAGRNARFGFHSYRLDATYQVPFADLPAEQNTERDFYRRQNIREAFIERVFSTPQSSLWEPSLAELSEAGVVHRLDEAPAPH